MPTSKHIDAMHPPSAYPPEVEVAIEQITQRLRDGLHPSRIYLFGSYARRDYGPDSDLDFLVVVPFSGEPRFRRAQQACQLLHGIGVPKDVLILSEEEWNRERRSGVSLSNVVEKEGILLYEA